MGFILISTLENSNMNVSYKIMYLAEFWKIEKEKLYFYLLLEMENRYRCYIYENN